MYYVYLLQSQVDRTFYIGKTRDIENRLSEHNAGKVYYTSRKMPWEIIYYEAYSNNDLASERERQLKRFSSAYTGLLKRLNLK